MHADSKKRLSIALAALLPLVGLDQWSKALAVKHIMPYERVAVAPFIDLVNVKNPGAAFGSFQGLGNHIFIAIAICAILFVLYLIARKRQGTVAFTLVLSGAIGNLIDRIYLGHVRDFIDVYVGSYHWPAFNVADSALTVGMCLLVLEAFTHKQPQDEQLSADAPPQGQ